MARAAVPAKGIEAAGRVSEIKKEARKRAALFFA